MALPHLPNELILHIASYLSAPSLNALHKTNHHLCALLTPLLHGSALTIRHPGSASILTWAAHSGYDVLVKILLKNGFCANTAIYELAFYFPDLWRQALPVLLAHGGKSKLFKSIYRGKSGANYYRRGQRPSPKVEMASAEERPECTCRTAGTAESPCGYLPPVTYRGRLRC